MTREAFTQRGYRSFLPPLHDADPVDQAAGGVPDRRDGAVYVAGDDVLLAVDVALATGRPLLLRGEPGSGKSSLAAFIARNLDWRYYEHVVTSRTRARDLLWTFDAVRKLANASSPADGQTDRDFADDPRLADHRYVEPGVMWWVIDKASALRRGLPLRYGEPDSNAGEPNAAINEHRQAGHAVILIDEIDKADPDVPNGLLVPLGSREFQVAETGALVKGEGEPGHRDHVGDLIIITTNEERELPAAFLRRCVVQKLEQPDRPQLIEIARRHVVQLKQEPSPDDLDLFGALADRFDTLRKEAVQRAVRRPSTAEYLDALHACRELGVTVTGPVWEKLEALVLDKSRTGSLTTEDAGGAARDGIP
jgi:MoxR-like ATPase